MTYDEFSQVRNLIARSLRAEAPAVVATLVARDGHSYRDVGAMMATNDALEIVGGVSGGCLEEYVGRAGRELLRDRESVLMSFDTAAEVPDRPRLGCGGRLEILVERADAAHLEYLDVLLAAMNQSDAVVTGVWFDDEGAAGPPGGTRVVFVDGRVAYGDLPDTAAREAAAEVVALRESFTVHAADATLSLAYVWPQPRLVVFGARDDAQPLVTIAKTAGWQVTVVDRRARLATHSRFPAADAVVAEPWDLAIRGLAFNAWTAAVVMTHSVDDDEIILAELLAHEPAYLGLLGPGVRTDRLWAGLPAAARSRVRSPVGLSLGDKSRSAVAVAIVAELVAWRRGRVVPAPAMAVAR